MSSQPFAQINSGKRGGMLICVGRLLAILAMLCFVPWRVWGVALIFIVFLCISNNVRYAQHCEARRNEIMGREKRKVE